MKSSCWRALVMASATVAFTLSPGCGDGGGRGHPAAVGLAAPGSIGPASSSTTGAFARTGPLSEPRVHHTATLLASGCVLIAGGQNGPGSVSATTELYDPATGRTTTGPLLRAARMHHAAIALPSGKVLVVGGQADTTGRSPLSSTELYDPATGAWSAGPSLATPRSAPAVALFRDGTGATDVLIAGGATYTNGLVTSLASADIYLAATNTITPAPLPMAEDRFGARAVRTASGEVLIAGGYSGLAAPGGPRPAASEIFEPGSGRFIPIVMIPVRAESALVEANEVLSLGGTDGTTALASVEAYASLAWSPASALARPRRALAAVALLSSGNAPPRILAIGGLDATGPLASCELVSTTSTPAPDLNVARAYATATLLPDGGVLVAGGLGANDAILSSLEVYSPRGVAVPGALAASGAASVSPTAAGGVELLPTGSASTGVDVTALVPSTGVAGSTVTITGTGFDPDSLNDRVTFNGTPAAVVAVDVSNPRAQTLTAVVPAGATSGPVVVTVGGLASPQAPFFTVAGSATRAPVILAVAPATGPVFMPVSISGQDFGPRPLVTFNGIPTASILNASTSSLPLIGQVSTLIVLVPPGATSGPLVVTNGTLASSPIPFTVR